MINNPSVSQASSDQPPKFRGLVALLCWWQNLRDKMVSSKCVGGQPRWLVEESLVVLSVEESSPCQKRMIVGAENCWATSGLDSSDRSIGSFHNSADFSPAAAMCENGIANANIFDRPVSISREYERSGCKAGVAPGDERDSCAACSSAYKFAHLFINRCPDVRPNRSCGNLPRLNARRKDFRDRGFALNVEDRAEDARTDDFDSEFKTSKS